MGVAGKKGAKERALRGRSRGSTSAVVAHRHMLALAYWFGLVGTLAFAAVYGLHSWARYQEENHARLALMAAMMAAATREGLNGQAARLTFLAEQLRALHPLRHRRRAGRLLRQYQRASPDITGVAVVGPGGRIVASAQGTGQSPLRGSHLPAGLWADWRKSLKTHGLSVCRPLYDPKTRQWLVGFGYTVWRAAGAARYMIFETMDFWTFDHALVRLPLIRGLAVGLLRNDYYLQAREPIPRGGLRGIMERPQAGILARTLITDGGRSAGFFMGLVNADDQYRIGAYERVAGYPLVAFADMARRQIIVAWWREQVEIPLGFLLIALLFSAVAYRRIEVLTRRWEQEKERQKSVLRSLAVHDPLTGLLNRAGLVPLLKRALERARRYEWFVVVGFLDVNDFKTINDQHGHAAGDAVLRELAMRLKRAMRSTDRVVRLGGDEFVFVMEGVRAKEDLQTVVDHIHAAITEPFVVDDVALRVRVSLGVTIYPADDEDADGLLRHADQAMYAAKTRRGAKWVQIYDPQRPRSRQTEGE